MKDNELTRNDIDIGNDIEVDCDIGQEITVNIQTWFDVDKKFHIDTSADAVWLNMYGKYNPYNDTLRIECEIDKPYESEYFDYQPTENEARLIKEMIAEKIKSLYNQTPIEFCESVAEQDVEIGGML